MIGSTQFKELPYEGKISCLKDIFAQITTPSPSLDDIRDFLDSDFQFQEQTLLDLFGYIEKGISEGKQLDEKKIADYISNIKLEAQKSQEADSKKADELLMNELLEGDVLRDQIEKEKTAGNGKLDKKEKEWLNSKNELYYKLGFDIIMNDIRAANKKMINAPSFQKFMSELIEDSRYIKQIASKSGIKLGSTITNMFDNGNSSDSVKIKENKYLIIINLLLIGCKSMPGAESNLIYNMNNPRFNSWTIKALHKFQKKGAKIKGRSKVDCIIGPKTIQQMLADIGVNIEDAEIDSKFSSSNITVKNKYKYNSEQQKQMDKIAKDPILSTEEKIKKLVEVTQKTVEVGKDGLNKKYGAVSYMITRISDVVLVGKDEGEKEKAIKLLLPYQALIKKYWNKNAAKNYGANPDIIKKTDNFVKDIVSRKKIAEKKKETKSMIEGDSYIDKDGNIKGLDYDFGNLNLAKECNRIIASKLEQILNFCKKNKISSKGDSPFEKIWMHKGHFEFNGFYQDGSVYEVDPVFAVKDLSVKLYKIIGGNEDVFIAHLNQRWNELYKRTVVETQPDSFIEGLDINWGNSKKTEKVKNYLDEIMTYAENFNKAYPATESTPFKNDNSLDNQEIYFSGFGTVKVHDVEGKTNYDQRGKQELGFFSGKKLKELGVENIMNDDDNVKKVVKRLNDKWMETHIQKEINIEDAEKIISKDNLTKKIKSDIGLTPQELQALQSYEKQDFDAIKGVGVPFSKIESYLSLYTHDEALAPGIGEKILKNLTTQVDRLVKNPKSLQEAFNILQHLHKQYDAERHPDSAIGILKQFTGYFGQKLYAAMSEALTKDPNNRGKYKKQLLQLAKLITDRNGDIDSDLKDISLAKQIMNDLMSPVIGADGVDKKRDDDIENKFNQNKTEIKNIFGKNLQLQQLIGNNTKLSWNDNRTIEQKLYINTLAEYVIRYGDPKKDEELWMGSPKEQVQKMAERVEELAQTSTKSLMKSFTDFADKYDKDSNDLGLTGFQKEVYDVYRDMMGIGSLNISDENKDKTIEYSKMAVVIGIAVAATIAVTFLTGGTGTAGAVALSWSAIGLMAAGAGSVAGYLADYIINQRQAESDKVLWKDFISTVMTDIATSGPFALVPGLGPLVAKFPKLAKIFLVVGNKLGKTSVSGIEMVTSGAVSGYAESWRQQYIMGQEVPFDQLVQQIGMGLAIPAVVQGGPKFLSYINKAGEIPKVKSGINESIKAINESMKDVNPKEREMLQATKEKYKEYSKQLDDFSKTETINKKTKKNTKEDIDKSHNNYKKTPEQKKLDSHTKWYEKQDKYEFELLQAQLLISNIKETNPGLISKNMEVVMNVGDISTMSPNDIKRLQKEIGLQGKQVDGILGPSTLNRLSSYLDTKLSGNKNHVNTNIDGLKEHIKDLDNILRKVEAKMDELVKSGQGKSDRYKELGEYVEQIDAKKRAIEEQIKNGGISSKVTETKPNRPEAKEPNKTETKAETDNTGDSNNAVPETIGIGDINDISSILKKGNIITIDGIKYKYDGIKQGEAVFVSGDKVVKVKSLLELKDDRFNLEPGKKRTNSGRYDNLDRALGINSKKKVNGTESKKTETKVDEAKIGSTEGSSEVNVDLEITKQVLHEEALGKGIGNKKTFFDEARSNKGKIEVDGVVYHVKEGRDRVEIATEGVGGGKKPLSDTEKSTLYDKYQQKKINEWVENYPEVRNTSTDKNTEIEKNKTDEVDSKKKEQKEEEVENKKKEVENKKKEEENKKKEEENKKKEEENKKKEEENKKKEEEEVERKKTIEEDLSEPSKVETESHAKEILAKVEQEIDNTNLGKEKIDSIFSKLESWYKGLKESLKGNLSIKEKIKNIIDKLVVKLSAIRNKEVQNKINKGEIKMPENFDKLSDIDKGLVAQANLMQERIPGYKKFADFTDGKYIGKEWLISTLGYIPIIGRIGITGSNLIQAIIGSYYGAKMGLGTRFHVRNTWRQVRDSGISNIPVIGVVRDMSFKANKRNLNDMVSAYKKSVDQLHDSGVSKEFVDHHTKMYEQISGKKYTYETPKTSKDNFKDMSMWGDERYHISQIKNSIDYTKISKEKLLQKSISNNNQEIEGIKHKLEKKIPLTPEESTMLNKNITGQVYILLKEASINHPICKEIMDQIGNVGNALDIVSDVSLKKVDRIVDKVINECDGKVEKITDIVRGTIVFDTVHDMQNAIGLISNHPNVKRFTCKDRLGNDIPYFKNCRDMLINIELENGFIFEVQFHLPEILKMKDPDLFNKSCLNSKNIVTGSTILSKDICDFEKLGFTWSRIDQEILEEINTKKEWNKKLIQYGDQINLHELYDIKRELPESETQFKNGNYKWLEGKGFNFNDIYLLRNKIDIVQDAINETAIKRYNNRTGDRYDTKTYKSVL